MFIGNQKHFKITEFTAWSGDNIQSAILSYCLSFPFTHHSISRMWVWYRSSQWKSRDSTSDYHMQVIDKYADLNEFIQPSEQHYEEDIIIIIFSFCRSETGINSLVQNLILCIL